MNNARSRQPSAPSVNRSERGQATDSDRRAPAEAPTGVQSNIQSNIHSNVGSFAAGALEAPERAEFEAHLASCDSCRREVVEFGETTAEMTRLVAVLPPPWLRADVLAAIHDVRQSSSRETPEVAEPATRTEPVVPLDEHPSVMPWALSSELTSEPPPASESTSESNAESTSVSTSGTSGQRRRILLLTVLLTAMLVAAVVLILSLGGSL